MQDSAYLGDLGGRTRPPTAVTGSSTTWWRSASISASAGWRNDEAAAAFGADGAFDPQATRADNGRDVSEVAARADR
jgi:hypothetical protein